VMDVTEILQDPEAGTNCENCQSRPTDVKAEGSQGQSVKLAVDVPNE
jgi:hypothetical protein